MIDTTALRSLPAVQELAKHLAREWYAAYRAVAAGPLLLWNPAPWEQFSDVEQEHHVAVQLDLLCNLQRPASRDALVRLIETAADTIPSLITAAHVRQSADNLRDDPGWLLSLALRVLSPSESPDV